MGRKTIKIQKIICAAPRVVHTALVWTQVYNLVLDVASKLPIYIEISNVFCPPSPGTPVFFMLILNEAISLASLCTAAVYISNIELEYIDFVHY